MGGGQRSAGPVTIDTVARHAQVSRQTVSNALNAPNKLLPATLERVTRSITELGYRPHSAARSLKTQSTRLIACRLLPATTDGTNAVLDTFLHALCTAARDRSYDVLTFSAATDRDELDVLADLMSRRAVDAYVLTGTHHQDARRSWLRDQGARFVSFGRPWGATDHGDRWVDVDGAEGIRLAVKHLMALRHRRIGFLGWPEGSDSGDDRYLGWERTVRAAGLPTRGLIARCSNNIADATSAAATLLARKQPPTALVCVSDTVDFGALQAARAAGLQVGTDVSLTGFDDSPVAPLTQPGLTSVRQPLPQVAERVLELLLDDRSGSAAGELVTPTLIVRESTAPAPA